MSNNYSNSTYSKLDSPAQMLDLTSSCNACRLYPYMKCKSCARLDPNCSGILQGVSASFKYDLAGQTCCDSSKPVKSCCGGGLRCKYN